MSSFRSTAEQSRGLAHRISLCRMWGVQEEGASPRTSEGGGSVGPQLAAAWTEITALRQQIAESSAATAAAEKVHLPLQLMSSQPQPHLAVQHVDEVDQKLRSRQCTNLCVSRLLERTRCGVLEGALRPTSMHSARDWRAGSSSS